VPQLLFAGFFIRIEDIPVYVRWGQWLCSLKYSLNLVYAAEFNDENCSDEEDARYVAVVCVSSPRFAGPQVHRASFTTADASLSWRLMMSTKT